MDFRYARPPPTDPQQPPLPPPQQQPWHSGQFQYHSPQQPWPPQQHSDQHLHPPPPYAAAAHPPPPPVPYNYSHPNRPPPLPQAHYPPVNQEWNNTNWGHQAWDYSAQNKNEDDWAARARAWAASKTVTDDQQQQQQQQSHSVPASRPEEINYQGQYSQNPDPPYPEYQQNSHPPPNYQQYPSFPPPPRPPANHFQEPSFNSGYTADGQFSYPARDGNLPNSAAAYSHQDNGPTSLSGHQQEVPSSYSSVAGKEEPRDMNVQSYQQSHMHYAPAPQHQFQPSISPNERSMSIEQPHYAYNNSSAEPTTDPSNQPLDFGPRYGHDHDPYGQSTYGHESGGSTGGLSTGIAIPSINAWNASAAPGMPYPSIPPVHPTGQQADHSPVSMHSAPLFGGMAGPGFQPGMSSANTAFPIGTSNAFNATNAFPGDTYGIPGFSERPKKASVPNWLKEEIIKKKPFIGSSAPGLSRQENESNEDDDMDQPLGKGEQVDGKSMESSRLTEEESEDEDQVEAARTAAINQEIKRILTEVLLKVTDELFDEIATQVIEEDVLNVEVEPKVVTSRDMISVSSSAATTPKSSAKVLIKTKGTHHDDANGNSSSSSPGDVLGLGNYASDDDDDDDDEDKEVQNSFIPSSTGSKPTVHLVVNGSAQVDGEVTDKKSLKEESDSHGVGPNGATDDYNDNSSVAKVKPDNSDVSKSNLSERGTDAGKHELLVKGGLNTENTVSDDAQGRSPRNGMDKNDNKRSSSKDYNGVESGKDKKRMKADENSKIQDEKHITREKKDDQNDSKEKLKERDLEKRVSKNEIQDDKKERDRDRRSHAKEDDRKRERKDEKNEKKHKRERSPSPGRHKRDRSLSPGRHRNSKDNSSVSRAHGSSDTSSSDSRRKVRSKRRDRSPSPVRSRRQVSRSPPSKRSQHRHSNYSSVESTRERRRSRSRTRR